MPQRCRRLVGITAFEALVLRLPLRPCAPHAARRGAGRQSCNRRRRRRRRARSKHRVAGRSLQTAIEQLARPLALPIVRESERAAAARLRVSRRSTTATNRCVAAAAAINTTVNAARLRVRPLFGTSPPRVRSRISSTRHRSSRSIACQRQWPQPQRARRRRPFFPFSSSGAQVAATRSPTRRFASSTNTKPSRAATRSTLSAAAPTAAAPRRQSPTRIGRAAISFDNSR